MFIAINFISIIQHSNINMSNPCHHTKMKKNSPHSIVHFTFPTHPTSTSQQLQVLTELVSIAIRNPLNLRIAVVLSENLIFKNFVEQSKPFDTECLGDLSNKSWFDCTKRANSRNKLIKSLDCRIIWLEKREVTFLTINRYKRRMII